MVPTDLASTVLPLAAADPAADAEGAADAASDAATEAGGAAVDPLELQAPTRAATSARVTGAQIRVRIVHSSDVVGTASRNSG
jgi:hypothetical protein